MCIEGGGIGGSIVEVTNASLFCSVGDFEGVVAARSSARPAELGPPHQLGERPLDRLRKGDLGAIELAAASFGEQGAK